MSTCAFCSKAAKISGEHIWSQWMRELFPSKRFRFFQRDESGKVIKTWNPHNLDLTANVVCKPCNEGWMSDLERQHAKPAMTALIVGDKGITVSQSQRQLNGAFAFKTAVIVDHMRRNRDPFVRRSVRYRFAESLEIPGNVQMWFAGFLPAGSGRVESFYPEGGIDSKLRIKMHVCTYAVGHLVFQVVSARFSSGMPSFSPNGGFEYLAIPFWPTIPKRIRWPPQDVLRTRTQFDEFSERWGTIKLRSEIS
jgi:hypothetical protein